MTKLNPAQLTFPKYLEVINPDGESHPSSAYNQYRATSISHEDKIEKYPNLVRQFMRHGLLFQVREEIIDRWDGDFVKYDENGEIERDSNGLATYIDDEEKAKKIQPRYVIEHAIFDVQNKLLVANTQDEWGCLLVMSDPAYRKFALGHELLSDHFKERPDRYSGGMTEAGYNCTFRAHQKLVKQRLQSGGFRQDYLDGKLAAKEIKEILKSSDVTKKLRVERYKELEEHGMSKDSINSLIKPPVIGKSSLDLSFNNPKNWLLHTTNNTAILYDKTLLDLLTTKDGDSLEDFLEKGIGGFVYVGGVYNADAIPKLYRLHGQNDQIKAFMTEVALNLNVGSPVRIFKKDLPKLQPILEGRVEFAPIQRSSMTNAVIEKATIPNLKDLSFQEKLLRKSKDPYEEKLTWILEKAHQLTEPKKTEDCSLAL